MEISTLLRKATLFTTVALLFTTLSLGQELDLERLEGLEARNIGPAGMSGRVTSIDVVLKNPDIIYAGTASGGLWKSTSGGIDWAPIFDDQPVASIGSIDIYQKNPSILYVGTGEGNPRNSQTNGNGMYKSLDGGKTWIHLGLDETRNIHRVIIHPDNPDVVYVAAQGPAWGETSERGVFKTTDGGETWENILYENERTGPADMVMDPENPNKLFVAMWEFRRWPHFFKSGGPGSGLHVTFDGGKTWTERTSEDGLPKGEIGRIGLAIAPTNPDVVYALIESKKNALYRSDDGGFEFKKIADEGIGNRPFYYADLFVDTQNENRVYNLYSVVDVSNDGGKTFETLIPYNEVHPDHHAWWQHPDNPDFIIDGNDGGLYISQDRGETWRFAENLPLAQFYHISVDMAMPYHVLGGMQDNGSWRGPSQVWRSGGIRNTYWEEVAFGDGFDVVPDESNPDVVYAMSQGGNLVRSNTATNEQTLIRPTHPDDERLRFNWNAGIAHDPFDETTIYYGSQFLHKSTDRGQTWTIISPDLTTNDPEKQKQLDSGGLTYDVTAAENFTTIVAVAPSPVEEGVIWVGTDDGNVQVTTDDGETWTNVAENIRLVPEGAWVPQIRASTYEAGEAFVVFDDHRRNNWEPYVFKTTDFGQNWTRLVDEDDVFGYALSFVQDPVEPNLMFLGTEFGLYVSLDGAETWTKWTNGYPTVSTMDLVIHPRDHDLVIGTFGRSAYVLDDIRPLRELAAEGLALLDEPIHVFEAPDAVLAEYGQAAGTRFAGAGMFAGENRSYGALISYSLNPDALESTEADSAETEEDAEPDPDSTETEGETPATTKVKVEILNEDGDVIRTLQDDAEAGVNRIVWNLTRKGVRSPGTPEPRPDAPEPSGPSVLPGTYTVRVSHGDQSAETTVEVELDPRIETSDEALMARNELVERWMANLAAATAATDRIRAAEETIGTVSTQLQDRDDDDAKAAKEKGEDVKKTLEGLKEQFTGKEVQGIRRDPMTVTSRLFMASRYINAWSDPTENEQTALTQAETTVEDAIAEVNNFFEDEWPAYQEAVEAAEVSLFESYEPLEVELPAGDPRN